MHIFQLVTSVRVGKAIISYTTYHLKFLTLYILLLISHVKYHLTRCYTRT